MVGLKSYVAPQLLAALTNLNPAVRRTTLDVFQTLATSITTRLVPQSYVPLIETVNQHREELEIDTEQLKNVLSKYLKAKSSSTVCTTLFELLKSTEVPEQVQRGLSIAQERVKSPEILKHNKHKSCQD